MSDKKNMQLVASDRGSVSPANISSSANGAPSDKQILEEETYHNVMGKIIERDFFPDLKKLKAQNEYLDAEEDNNFEKLQRVISKYGRHSVTPCESPATFETPNPASELPIIERILETDTPTGSVETNDSTPKMSLDQFFGKYTNVENVHFEEVMKLSSDKHKEKYPWMYKDEVPQTGSRNQDAIMDGEFKRPAIVDTWGYKNMNPLLFNPDGVKLSDTERREKLLKQRTIVHSNTALKESPFDESRNQADIREMALRQASFQEGNIGIDGKVKTITFDASETHPFLRTPSPMTDVISTPLMSWGEIDGTPFRLDGSDTPRRMGTPVFRIQNESNRERLAHALADEVSSRQNEKKKLAAAAKAKVITPSPSRSAMFKAMSPAGRRLATSTLGGRLFGDQALRRSYTPGSGRSKTPSTPRQSTSAASATQSDYQDITDNLLSLEPSATVRSKPNS